jgi:hypothetical protein
MTYAFTELEKRNCSSGKVSPEEQRFQKFSGNEISLILSERYVGKKSFYWPN